MDEEYIVDVTETNSFKNEYVYDICMNEAEPWFFANGILVHNSAYISAYPIIREQVKQGIVEWNADIAIKKYNSMKDEINSTFPDFMQRTFNCPPENGNVISCDREIVARRAFFIVKKRYAALMIDKKGVRYDVDGNAGKLKAMGLDLRRSDTPVVVQKFLKDVLVHFLSSNDESKVIDEIKDFKKKFDSLPLYEQGTPRRVNKLTYYSTLINQGKGNRVPGHVRAAINWNTLKSINKDWVSTKITDGMKCIVCPLAANPYEMTSIAYPVDEAHLPDWFTKLPFDHQSMVDSVVDKKIENLFGKLPNWSRIESAIKKTTTLDDLFF
ncbi:DNA polymerase [uncultured archaeon]|nr:DNA polymerase [uncultured archaeon]